MKIKTNLRAGTGGARPDLTGATSTGAVTGNSRSAHDTLPPPPPRCAGY